MFANPMYTSTPASPTPETGDGDDLLLELRSFLAMANSISHAPISLLNRNVDAAIRLIRRLPAAKEAVLEYFSSIIDKSILSHICSLELANNIQAIDLNGNDILSSYDQKKTVQALSDLETQLSDNLKTNAIGWGWCISSWAIFQLGEISNKYTTRINKIVGCNIVSENMHKTLSIWLSIYGTRMLIDLIVKCVENVNKCAIESERVVSVLLDTSLTHGAKFDWAVAHIGRCFPSIVCGKILSVGIKDYVATNDNTIENSESGELLTSTGNHKINSVALILSHLANSHLLNLRRCFSDVVKLSLLYNKYVVECEEKKLQLATIPYLLHLATLSDTLRSAMTSDIRMLFAEIPEIAEKIAEMIPEWIKGRHFLGYDDLANQCINLITATSGYHGKDIIDILFELSTEKTYNVGVTYGCRYLLELLFSELLDRVHVRRDKRSQNCQDMKIITTTGTHDGIPILDSVCENYSLFLERYFLTNDEFERECIFLVANIASLYKGQSIAIQTLRYGIMHIDDKAYPGQLLALLIFVSDIEIWQPEIVDIAMNQCMNNMLKSTAAFGREEKLAVNPSKILDNMVTILQFQIEDTNGLNKVLPVSRFVDSLQRHQDILLSFLDRKHLTIKILKIFQFVSYSTEQSPALMHKATHILIHTLFIILGDHDIIKEEDERLDYLYLITNILTQIAYSHPFGLTMVLRCMMEAAIKSKFATTLGGKDPTRTNFKTYPPYEQVQDSFHSLFEENLASEQMSTRQLGTSTSFHNGVIQRKRPRLENDKVADEEVEWNIKIFVSLLFKMCHQQLSSIDAKGQERCRVQVKLKDATKQLSLILVDLISPDIMYNGFPWPEEDFARVTVERDLRINKTFQDHPVLWKILFGLAEARPALCYCSVLIRALIAVEISHWRTTASHRAGQNPVELGLTKQILELMSIGQYIPPPLDSLSDVCHVMHPFYLYCVLVDIWNYVRDNVPSPASFSSNVEGIVSRDFGMYKSYKQYCERFRLVMIQYIVELPDEFKSFFVDKSEKSEKLTRSG